jgi:misacylated tRNA(Ala) deacylase
MTTQTEALFRQDAYLKTCEATVVAVQEDGVILDRTVFYPLGGGQPGDTGTIRWQGGALTVIDTRYGEKGQIYHRVERGSVLPETGDTVLAEIHWERRYRHMRMHTAMHLLGAVLPYGVTGGNISADKSRLDFDMEDTVDKVAVGDDLTRLVRENHPITSRWITDEELDAQPDLVRTLSVKPPRGVGPVRLLEIAGVDLQPCGGTHLRSTGEVGQVRVGKVENKGRHNRRVHLHLDD